MAAEIIHEFTLHHRPFYVLWKPGTCLLRTVECAGTDDARHYTACDLFQYLYDHSDDYALSAEEAVARAPRVAELLMIEERKQEAGKMAELYASAELQAQYPVYAVLEVAGEKGSYPVIWGSHNFNTYVCRSGEWFFVAPARNEAEAISLAAAYVGEKGDSTSAEKPRARQPVWFWRWSRRG